MILMVVVSGLVFIPIVAVVAAAVVIYVVCIRCCNCHCLSIWLICFIQSLSIKLTDIFKQAFRKLAKMMVQEV